ncbi:DUF1127 domain-containing protein [Loktanella sp. DJP18]|uniref:DUF1127 domain-containing protein n=1 Tax=Loktanella sp. DJP18 TaxID=3409788 RepID=UPI003BB6DD22
MTFSSIAVHKPSFSGALTQIAARLALAAKRRAKYRQTVKELSALSLHELDDIGVARGDIHAIAREAMNQI